MPRFGISTEQAYELLAQTRAHEERRGAVALEADAFGSWGAIGRLSGNDFEAPVFGKEPELRELFERLAETRPLLVRLCGSGSALIAVYRSEIDRDGAELTMGQRDHALIATKTRDAPLLGG